MIDYFDLEKILFNTVDTMIDRKQTHFPYLCFGTLHIQSRVFAISTTIEQQFSSEIIV